MTVVIAAVAVVLLATIGLILYTRRPRQDAGLTSFRRHIDALSPESRREVMDRVRPSERNGDLSKNDTSKILPSKATPAPQPEAPEPNPTTTGADTEPQEPTN